VRFPALLPQALPLIVHVFPRPRGAPVIPGSSSTSHRRWGPTMFWLEASSPHILVHQEGCGFSVAEEWERVGARRGSALISRAPRTCRPWPSSAAPLRPCCWSAVGEKARGTRGGTSPRRRPPFSGWPPADAARL
jgi:hypothetical protein